MIGISIIGANQIAQAIKERFNNTGVNAGLALATSLSACLQALLLFLLLRKEAVYKPVSGWVKFLLQIVIAAAAMALLIFYYIDVPEQWFAWGLLQRVWHLSLWIVAGLICYFAVVWMTGLRWQNMTAQQ